MTLRVCLSSLGRYLNWWWRSICLIRWEGWPMTLRRFLFLFILFPLFLILQTVHWVGWSLDALLFPSTRKVSVKRPIFITGIPRSGTTFVHRAFAHAPELTTFPLWEVLLAPSVCEKRILRGLALIDRKLGQPLRKTADWLIAQITGDFEAIHGVGLNAPEEDYLTLLPFGGCFLLALAFPHVRELRDLARLERIPERRRNEVLDLYHQCLQKKLYDCGPGIRLLSKNAAFGSWLPYLAERYPDAVFLLCIREPLAALSSQISSLAGTRTIFGINPEAKETVGLIKRVFRHNYALFAKLSDDIKLQQQCRILVQEDLKSAPDKVLATAADFSGLMESVYFRQHLTSLRQPEESKHTHCPTSIPGGNQEFLDVTAAAYAAILDVDCRIYPT